MRALILCGGLGTRLRSAVPNLPKCLAPVTEKPFLYYVLRHLERQDFSDVILCTCYMHDKIIECFGTRFNKVNLHYSIQGQPKGTADALRQAAKELPKGTNRVVVINGDTWLPIRYHEVIAYHEKLSAKITVVAYNDIISGTFVADVSWLKQLKRKRFEDNIKECAIFDTQIPFLDIGTPKDYLRAQSLIG